MHSATTVPILTVEESRMRNFDPQDPGDLSLMWSVFSKASDLCENGKRLENLTWRLWGREALCCSSRSSTKQPLVFPVSRSLPQPLHATQIPELSSSVTSVSSAGSSADAASAVDSSNPSQSQLLEDQRCIVSPQSRGKERHITPSHLQNLVTSIKSKQALCQPIPSLQLPRPRTLSPPHDTVDEPLPSSPRPVHVNTESSTSTVGTNNTTSDSFCSPTSASETSVSSHESSHSVVRGFTPGTGVTSYTSKSQLAPEPRPIPRSIATPQAPLTRTKKGMFMLGGSSGEDDSSFRTRMSPTSHPTSVLQGASNGKKQTSFKDEVMVMKQKYPTQRSSAVFESDDEGSDTESDISESAIEDDEDAWEDDSDEIKDDDKEIKFHRVDSKANLSTRRSLLTLNLAEQRSGGRLQNANSRSSPAIRRCRTSTPNGPSMPASPESESTLDSHMLGSRPIFMNAQTQPVAPLHSPRTARRNMLAGELSESLRKNMLWERQQKNPLANAHMKRAHTSCDIKSLPKLSEANETNDVSSMPKNGSKLPWNHYFEHGIGEYNQNGW